jgi:Fic family protein
MIRYNWEQKDWPHFTYKVNDLHQQLLTITKSEAKYDGALTSLPKGINAETILDLMVKEALKTSKIEGEVFSRKDVLSSIKKNLGLSPKNTPIQNKSAEGICKLMIKMRAEFEKPLTQKMLLEWHQLLFEYDKNISVGKWRTHKEPMQVVSGAYGKQKIHFEAPPSERVAAEMKQFVQWFNDTSPTGKNPILFSTIRAAVAHLYFESIHPFEDGNGRVGRALIEKALAQGAGKPVLISISSAIEKNKKLYYSSLQKNSLSLDITKWLNYFVDLMQDALQETDLQMKFTIAKHHFFENWKGKLNTRQMKAIKKMFDEGTDGFEGGMNAAKYGSINKTSKATATRDLQELVQLKIFKASGGGRSISYNLIGF